MSRTMAEDVAGCMDPKKWLPMGDYILVEVIERTKTSGGIILPKGEATECCFGRVIAKGSGTLNTTNGQIYPLEFKPGDYVLCMQYQGEKIQTRHGEYRFYHEYGVWAKILIEDPEASNFSITAVIPYANRNLVDIEPEHKTRGGIILPSKNSSSPSAIAKVVRTGTGLRNSETGEWLGSPVSAGDKVLMRRFDGADIILGNGSTLRLIQDHEVICVVED